VQSPLENGALFCGIFHFGDTSADLCKTTGGIAVATNPIADGKTAIPEEIAVGLVPSKCNVASVVNPNFTTNGTLPSSASSTEGLYTLLIIALALFVSSV
jgi:hypothetical protein